MRRVDCLTRSLAISLLGMYTCGVMSGCSRSGKEDKPVSVVEDDAEMNAAIATAREKLPHFWQVHEHPTKGEKNFALKVRIEDPNGTEHFWVNSIRGDGGKIFGVIANDPEIVKSVKNGQEVEIPEGDISDWMYIRNDKMIGNYTLRALFKQMPKTEVERFKAIMEEP